MNKNIFILCIVSRNYILFLHPYLKNNFVTSEEWILKFRKQWKLIAAIFILFAAATFYFMHYKYDYRNKAEVTLVVNNAEQGHDALSQAELTVINFMSALSTTRIYQFVYSDEMIDYLQRVLNLADHYDIDTTNIYFHARLTKAYLKHLKITKDNFNVLRITVFDRQDSYAASLLDAIIFKLTEINQAYLAQNLKARGQIYKSMIGDIRKEFQFDFTNLNKQVAELSTAKTDGRLKEKIDDLKFRIFETTTKLEGHTNDLSQTMRLYKITEDIISEPSQRTFFVLNKIEFEDVSNKMRNKILISLGMGLLAVNFYIVLYYIFYSYKSMFRLIIFGKE